MLLLSAPPRMADGSDVELAPRLLSLSADGLSFLIEFGNEVERQQAPGNRFAAIQGFASKAAEQAARIAGVLTLYEDLDAAEVPD